MMLGVPSTGSTSHNIGLDDPWITHSKTTQKSVKRHFGLNFFFACGALKGASPRGQPRIGYPGRHHHPRQSGSGSEKPGLRGQRRERRVRGSGGTAKLAEIGWLRQVDAWQSRAKEASDRPHATDFSVVFFHFIIRLLNSAGQSVE